MMVSLGENFIKLLKAEVMRYGIVLLEALDSGIPWVVPLPSTVTVTTRIIVFLVGDPNLNLRLPLLLGGGTTQGIVLLQAFYSVYLRIS